MSQPNPGLPTSKAAAAEYVQWLAALRFNGKPVVKAVYLSGSRSPDKSKEAREDSDWDFNILSDIPNLKLPQPKKQGVLFAEIPIITNVKKIRAKSVMVYPEDPRGVFK